MKSAGYEKLQNKNKRKVMIIIFIIICVLIAILIMLQKIYERENPIKVSYDNLTTIKQVIEYYESKYISEEESTEKDYYLDVYLKFKLKPYNDDDTSNEEYYNNLLEDCAKIIRYESFRMIDEQNDITVQIICDGTKIKTIIINGIEDYFIYMDSQLSMKEFVEIEETDFSITSEVLQRCLDNYWNKNIDFGTRDSIFEEYYIYFDEGLKVRSIGDKIYNIIFTKKYNGEVINNNFVGKDLETIESNLGKAPFKSEGIIGYKGKDMYVFFTENEISVYRRDKSQTNEFFDLAEKYIKKEIDFLEFMNELTYLWPDYSSYTYSSKTVFISYPLNGIEISINNQQPNGIYIYNNINTNLSKVKGFLENTDFVAKLQIDAVLTEEIRRVNNNKNELNLCKEYTEEIQNELKENNNEEIEKPKESFHYGIYALKDNNNLIYEMKFIAKSDDMPNRELQDTISTYLWATNTKFIYSKANKGIYLYNLEDGRTTRILTGEEKYELKEYEDGKLKFDNNEIELPL